jgi:hypothetical protein
MYACTSNIWGGCENKCYEEYLDLTPWNRVLEKLTVAQPLMESEGSLSYSKELATCPYREPDEATPHF